MTLMGYIAYQMLAVVQIFLGEITFRIEEHCNPGALLQRVGSGEIKLLSPTPRIFHSMRRVGVWFGFQLDCRCVRTCKA